MPYDTQLIRRFYDETPGAAKRLHLDNCGSSLMSTSVAKALEDHLALEIAVGGYVTEERRSNALESLYVSLSRLLGGQPTDYAITNSAVDAWTKGFYSIPLKAGDVVLTSFNEYCSNAAAYLHRKERDGIEIRVAPSNPDGSFNIDNLKNLIDDRVKVISLSHMACSSGQVAPAREIGKIARDSQAVFCLDTCQTAGQIALNAEELGCDILSGTSRKFFRGPRGVGFLYLSPSFREKMSPMIRTNNSGTWTSPDTFDVRSETAQLETWEKSTFARVGFGKALDNILEEGPDLIYGLIEDRAAALRAALAGVPGLTLTCPPDATGAIIGFILKGWQPTALKKELEERDIAIQLAESAHSRYDFDRRGLTSVARVSPHVYTRDEDIARFCETLESLAGHQST